MPNDPVGATGKLPSDVLRHRADRIGLALAVKPAWLGQQVPRSMPA